MRRELWPTDRQVIDIIFVTSNSKGSWGEGNGQSNVKSSVTSDLNCWNASVSSDHAYHHNAMAKNVWHHYYLYLFIICFLYFFDCFHCISLLKSCHHVCLASLSIVASLIVAFVFVSVFVFVWILFLYFSDCFHCISLLKSCHHVCLAS